MEVENVVQGGGKVKKKKRKINRFQLNKAAKTCSIIDECDRDRWRVQIGTHIKLRVQFGIGVKLYIGFFCV